MVVSMSEETIGAIIAVVFLGVFLWFTRNRTPAPMTGGSTPAAALALSAAVAPSDFETGPSYFIASQPYYFAPPVGNMMPQAVASNTISTNADDGSIGGCGCG
jgi:hypothetical protein